jgi:twitching motility protein PilT
MIQLDDILRMADDRGASDVHLIPHHPPLVRVNTVMEPLTEELLTPEQTQGYLDNITNDRQRKLFEEHLDLDFSHAVTTLGRYRVNAHAQRGGTALAMRVIRTRVPQLTDLNLPEVIQKLTWLPRGLVLVTGDTGSGKSTTLAAMIQAMNDRYRKHIITLEDPVEYELTSRQCVIEQRELGVHMPSFASGLKHALRQDPDIILVGEMRDLDTTALAMSAAETGHLVLSTLHTCNAGQTVERIIDMYPAGQQNQIRSMLGNTLQAVVSQTLFSRVDRPGMVPAVEVLLCTPAVRNIIRENRTFEIPNVIETSRRAGMVSLDASIAELYFNGFISRQDAVAQSAYPEQMERQLAA